MGDGILSGDHMGGFPGSVGSREIDDSIQSSGVRSLSLSLSTFSSSLSLSLCKSSWGWGWGSGETNMPYKLHETLAVRRRTWSFVFSEFATAFHGQDGSVLVHFPTHSDIDLKLVLGAMLCLDSNDVQRSN